MIHKNSVINILVIIFIKYLAKHFHYFSLTITRLGFFLSYICGFLAFFGGERTVQRRQKAMGGERGTGSEKGPRAGTLTWVAQNATVLYARALSTRF